MRNTACVVCVIPHFQFNTSKPKQYRHAFAWFSVLNVAENLGISAETTRWSEKHEQISQSNKQTSAQQNRNSTELSQKLSGADTIHKWFIKVFYFYEPIDIHNAGSICEVYVWYMRRHSCS